MKQTCVFYSVQALEEHTNADIWADLYLQYKNAMIQANAHTRYQAILPRWLSLGATTQKGMRRFHLWLGIWQLYYF